jgi:hypothetical protein
VAVGRLFSACGETACYCCYVAEGQPAILATPRKRSLHLNAYAVVMQAAVKATMQLRRGMAGGVDVSMSLLF